MNERTKTETDRKRFRLFDDASLERLVLNELLSDDLRHAITDELVRRRREAEA